MKRGIFYVISAVILAFCVSLAYAQQETNQIMEELNKELEQEKVFLPRELKDMDKSLRNSVEHGLSKEDLKTILSDLKNKEVDHKEIKNTIDAMNDLLKAGIEPKEAGNIVSQAAHLAKDEGLKGTALAARVHEAIQTRKAEHETLKQKIQEQEEHQEQHKEEHKGEIQAQEMFKEKAREQESHGVGQGQGKGKR
jgi:hypothetical protein